MRSLLGPVAYRHGWLAVACALAACGIVAYLAGQWAGSMGGAVALAVALTAGVSAWLTRRLDDLRGPQWPPRE